MNDNNYRLSPSRCERIVEDILESFEYEELVNYVVENMDSENGCCDENRKLLKHLCNRLDNDYIKIDIEKHEEYQLLLENILDNTSIKYIFEYIIEYIEINNIEVPFFKSLKRIIDKKLNSINSLDDYTTEEILEHLKHRI